MRDDENLLKLEQERIRDKSIIESNENAYEENKTCAYTEEQIVKAQEENAKHLINELYEEKIFPYTNAVLYLIYYVLTLILMPMIYMGHVLITAVLAYFLLLVVVIIIKIVEKAQRKNIKKEHPYLDCLVKFSNGTGTINYIMVSIGYMLTLMTKWYFWIIYVALVLFFLISIYFYVIKPVRKMKVAN